MEALITQVEPIISKINIPLKIAIMGCVVNGIGEGKEADLGIAGGTHQAVIFRKGNIVKKVDENNLLEAFKEELNSIIKEKSSIMDKHEAKRKRTFMRILEDDSF